MPWGSCAVPLSWYIMHHVSSYQDPINTGFPLPHLSNVGDFLLWGVSHYPSGGKHLVLWPTILFLPSASMQFLNAVGAHTTIRTLQVLKYLYQRERHSFTAGVLPTEEDYNWRTSNRVSSCWAAEGREGGRVQLHDLYTNWTIESD